MSDLIITQVNNIVDVEEQPAATISAASPGPQGPKGDTGATGAQGPSGIIAVTAPITNSGTSTSANIGVSAGSTSAAGVLQLTNSVSSTSTTTAATPNAVKTANDNANTRLLQYALPWQTKYRSTYWYESRNGSTLSNAGATLNRLYVYPVFIQESITIDRLGMEVQTSAASSTVRLGIYNSDSNGEPSTLVLDAGTVSGTTTGLKAITVSQTLSAGLYYFAWVWQGATGRTITYGSAPTSGNWAPIASTTQGPSAAYFAQYHQDSISGALPSTWGSVFVSSAAPTRIQWRIA